MTEVQPTPMLILNVVQPEEFVPGDILAGLGVDLSVHFYKVLNVTPQRLRVIRLRCQKRELHTSRGGAEYTPKDVPFGEERLMTRRGNGQASLYGQKFRKMYDQTEWIRSGAPELM